MSFQLRLKLSSSNIVDNTHHVVISRLVPLIAAELACNMLLSMKHIKPTFSFSCIPALIRTYYPQICEVAAGAYL